MTAEGKKELEDELRTLIASRPAIDERIATARAFGDLSENEEYSSARNEQKMAEGRILEIQDILPTAAVSVTQEFITGLRGHVQKRKSSITAGVL